MEQEHLVERLWNKYQYLRVYLLSEEHFSHLHLPHDKDLRKFVNLVRAIEVPY